MNVFFRYLKYKAKGIFISLLFFAVFAASMLLYGISASAAVYPVVICAVLGILYLAGDFLFFQLRRKKELAALRGCITEASLYLPSPAAVADEEYSELIVLLCDKIKEAERVFDDRYCGMTDYYTVWAHQIKTPIAAMRLRLQNEDTELSRKLQNDLFRVEGYVNMALTYLRLESDSTDYVIKEQNLDRIIRECVKKFSGEFILKKLTLNYTPTDLTVVTDEKWLSFVIEQLLSNALKYTAAGSIGIYSPDGSSLCISDTGIGITPEDIPRIFENGFTGKNGRYDKRSSGIGLYLCRRICKNLGHGISVTSVVGGGSVFKIDFSDQM